MWEYHIAESLDYQLFSEHNFAGDLKPEWFLLKNKDTLFRGYAKTLEAYELIFKHPPPLSVWEKPEQKFLNKEKYSSKIYDITGILNFHFKNNQTRLRGHKLRVYEKNKNEAVLAISGMCALECPE